MDIEDLMFPQRLPSKEIKKGDNKMKIKGCPHPGSVREKKNGDPQADKELLDISEKVYFCDTCSVNVYCVKTEEHMNAHKAIKNKPRCVRIK